MKTNTSFIRSAIVLFIALSAIIGLVSCQPSESTPPSPESSLWDTATYINDATIGEGSKTVTVKITAEDRSVTLTVKTNGDTLSDALYPNGIVNDPSFFNTANGIKADYSVNESWWKVLKDGAATPKGIADTPISDGEAYEIVYTIGY